MTLQEYNRVKSDTGLHVLCTMNTGLINDHDQDFIDFVNGKITFHELGEIVAMVHREEQYKRTAAYEIKISTKKKSDKIGLCNVYLMLDERTGFIKIGKTKKPPEYRERTLQSDNPLIRLIYFVKSTRILESTLHELYKHKRVRGEWFNIHNQDIRDIKSIMDKDSL